jgi:GNAT superfamily N-acetyltransferase
MSDEITIRDELRPGDLGRIVALHGKSYEPLGGYGLRFEAYVGRTLAEYVLENNGRGRVWLAEKSGELVGCAAIVLRGEGVSQLRWVVVAPSARGQGLGSKLMSRTLDYARDQNSKAVILETTDGLPESQALYEKLGFRVTSNSVEELWDGKRPLICMKLDLA